MTAVMTAVLRLWWFTLRTRLVAIVVVSAVVCFIGLFITGIAAVLIVFALRQYGTALFAAVFAMSLFSVIHAQGAAVSDIATRSAAGEPVSIGSVLQRALGHVVPAIVIGLVFVLGVMAGTGALLIPGFLFGTACSVALPVYIAEKPPGLLKTFTRAFGLGDTAWARSPCCGGSRSS